MTTIATTVPVPVNPVAAPVKKIVRRRVTSKAVATATPLSNEETVVPAAPEAPKVAVVAAVATPAIAVPSLLVNNDEELDLGVEPVEDVATVLPTVAKKKAVKGANKERLFQEFEKLYEGLDKVLTEQNLKSTLKDLKAVRDMTYRLLKLKTVERQKRDTNNSGFMKPIRVSGELEAFLQKNGLYQTDLTRAYLTTVLCSYIKSKDLQNPSDRRIIFPDEDLKSLFNITDNDNSEPLTYYSLQKRIQTHIFKN